MICEEKKTYNTFSEAKLAANKLDNRHKYNAQHAYLCDACGLYHLSSMSRKDYKSTKHYKLKHNGR